MGKYYQVELSEEGTDAQRKTFYALCDAYWFSGQHSYKATSKLHFQELMKLYLGAGAEKYHSLVDDNGKPLDEPETRWRVKSWTRYSKAERASAIMNIISEMLQIGIDTKKFREILDGMEENSLGRGI